MDWNQGQFSMPPIVTKYAPIPQWRWHLSRNEGTPAREAEKWREGPRGREQRVPNVKEVGADKRQPRPSRQDGQSPGLPLLFPLQLLQENLPWLCLAGGAPGGSWGNVPHWA